MNRLVAIVLLFGYVMLVPFCFFGGMLVASAHTIDMFGGFHQQMGGCGMSDAGCALGMGSGVTDSTTHHVGMYLSISQTPLPLFFATLILLTIFLLTVFGSVGERLSALLSSAFLRPFPQRAGKERSNTRHDTLTWLSLFETSPNFA